MREVAAVTLVSIHIHKLVSYPLVKSELKFAYLYERIQMNISFIWQLSLFEFSILQIIGYNIVHINIAEVSLPKNLLKVPMLNKNQN